MLRISARRASNAPVAVSVLEEVTGMHDRARAGSEPENSLPGRARKRARSHDLVLAAQSGDMDSVQDLLNAGVNPDAASAWPITALELAAQNGHAEVVRSLLWAGADVNVRAIGRWTPLMKAAAQGFGEIAKLLVAAGADLNAANKDGDTALILASRNGHARMVHFLLMSGARPGIENRWGKTALHYAVNANYKLIADLIREASKRQKPVG
jgi:ankyrin repeat protein